LNSLTFWTFCITCIEIKHTTFWGHVQSKCSGLLYIHNNNNNNNNNNNKGHYLIIDTVIKPKLMSNY